MNPGATAMEVSIRLPQRWIELDPRAEDIVAELRRAVSADQVTGISQDELTSLLAPVGMEIRRLSGDVEFVLVGLFADVIPVAGQEVPMVLTAHALLAVARQGATIAEVHAGLAADDADLADGSEVRMVTLALAGPAVRQSGPVTINHPDWDSPVPGYQRRFFCQTPGSDRIAVLSFLTPNVDLAEQFNEVFDAVADSLEFAPAGS